MNFLLECNNLRIPDGDFQKQFCCRCANVDCELARAKGSRFDQRVQNWEARLFTEVPTIGPEDSRYQGIANQPFVNVGPASSPYEVQAWVDPLAPPDPLLTPLVEPVKDLAPEGGLTLPLPPPIQAQPARQPLRFQGGQPLNAPKPSQVLLPGGPPPVASLDPWQGPTPTAHPSTSGGVVVKQGARVKMSGQGGR